VKRAKNNEALETGLKPAIKRFKLSPQEFKSFNYGGWFEVT
jgi:hypothetical protein